ncbi:MAG: hypothetical protein VB111_08005 [Clostridiaceae bacterium]|nr:hypothetical protein [Clostridiaceae bacterium]
MDLHNILTNMPEPAPGAATDMPLGLGIRIAQDPRATEAFAMLPEESRKRLILYVEGAATGDEALERVRNAVSALSRRAEEGNAPRF